MARSQNIQPQQSHFVSPIFDFLCIGGLTFLLFPLMLLINLDNGVLLKAAIVFYLLTFIINNPHFMQSYQILYTGYLKKISGSEGRLSQVRYIIAGIIAPIGILTFYAFALHDGIKTGSAVTLGYAVNAMFFMVGWHYIKQGYGILMTLSARSKFFFTDRNKNVLLYNGYLVWIATWIQSNGLMAREDYGVPITTIQFPEWTTWIWLPVALLGLKVFHIFWSHLKQRTLHFNAMTGYVCAVYLWTAFVIVSPLFIFVIPLLHSLQYLLFVGKLRHAKETEGHTEPENYNYFKSRFILGSFALGVLAFGILPYGFDFVIPYDTEVFGSSLFYMMFLVFINIHHYFIDFAIWRKDNPEMKYLFR